MEHHKDGCTDQRYSSCIKMLLSHAPQVTYADLSVAVLLEMLAKNHPAILDSLPTLAKLKISVEQLPAIDKWIKSRPETPY